MAHDVGFMPVLIRADFATFLLPRKKAEFATSANRGSG